MPGYFNNFPVIQYKPAGFTKSVSLRDITRRVGFVDNIRDNAFTYLPYTIQSNETVEEVAYYYYGDAEYSWLIYLANQIIDPYYQWPMNTDVLFQYIANKYKDKAAEWQEDNPSEDLPVGMGVVWWTQRTDIVENIQFYRRISNPSETISYDTYDILADEQTAYLDLDFDSLDWEPIRIYEYEDELNESRRNIQLVNKDYRDEIEDQLKRLINND